MMLGDAAVDRLAGSHVAIVGLGAVGSYAVEGLARAGVGRLTLVDFDQVKPSNINRQLYALESTIGQPKARVAAARVRDINPGCDVRPLELFAHSDTLDEILSGPPDLVVDAIDGLRPKRVLIQDTVQRSIGIIAAMGAALRTDPSAVCVGPLRSTRGCPLAKRLRRMLRDHIDLDAVQCVYSDEVVPEGSAREPDEADLAESPTGRGRQRRTLPSLPTLTGIFGLTVANEAIRSLVGDAWPR
jgi:tRNA A37 threonylcarbamoyladenosine dehydratase